LGNPQERQAANSQQPSTADQHGTENSPFVVKLQPTPKTQAEAEQDAKDRDEKAANDRETLATNRNIVIVGFLQLAVFAGQLFVFGYQAFKLRQTIITMREIAGTQSADTKQTMITAERAYISVRSLGVTPPPMDGATEGLVATILLQNTGNTPTKHMIFHSSMNIFSGDIPADFDFSDLDQRQPHQLFIGPKAWGGTFGFTINREGLVSTQAGCRIFIWGWADYNDTFPGTPRHRTEFCYEVLVERRQSAGSADRWDFGNSQYRRHNAADDECYRRPAPYTPPTGSPAST
jgi:hypothetical protein